MCLSVSSQVSWGSRNAGEGEFRTFFALLDNVCCVENVGRVTADSISLTLIFVVSMLEIVQLISPLENSPVRDGETLIVS